MTPRATLKLSDTVTIMLGDCRDILPIPCDAVVTERFNTVRMRLKKELRDQ